MANQDDFFDKEICDRCGNELGGRTTSWFNTETICVTCSRWETKIKEARPESSSELEGIGHIPDVDFEVNWGEEVEV